MPPLSSGSFRVVANVRVLGEGQGLELQIFNKPQKMIRNTNVDDTTNALPFAKHVLPAVRSITMNFIRCSEPFLFKNFRAVATFSIFGTKIISLIINKLDTTFKNSSKFIWISQNKSSIFVSSKQLSIDIKTKIK